MARGENTHILLIEDNRLTRQMLELKVNRNTPFDVVGVGNLEDAKAELAENKNCFFAIVADLGLPDAEPEDTLALLEASGISSIIFSSSYSHDLRMRLWQNGIADYIVKTNPKAYTQLIKTVNRLYRNRDKKALIINDDQVIREQINQLLLNHKFETMMAVNGQDGLNKMDECDDISLIILDSAMPEMDGFAFLEVVQQHPYREHMSVIALTGNEDPTQTVRFLKGGADNCMSVPFINEEFYWRIYQNMDLMEYVQDLKFASERDYLTGLYNRRYLMSLGQKMWAQAKRNDLPFTVGILDLDRFKNINDTYGHEAGDRVLEITGKIIADQLRESDLGARYGGEEFCIFAICSEPSVLFERIREAIESTVVKTVSGDISYTVSIGVNSDMGDSLEEMINTADHRLYHSKRHGRNCVTLGC